VIYPGKVASADTFRIGCIGAIGPPQMHEFLAAAADSLKAMGIKQL